MRIRIEGDPGRAEDVHWRGIVLTNFDGKRWFTPRGGADRHRARTPRANILSASDAAPGDHFNSALHRADGADRDRRDLRRSRRRKRCAGASALKASAPEFSGRDDQLGYLFIDRTGSIFNPVHNYAKIRYEATSDLPIVRSRRAAQGVRRFIPTRFARRICSFRRARSANQEAGGRITAKSPNEYDKAASIERYLITHYTYTLDLTGADERTIRWPSFFSCGARVIANISPRP